MDRDRFMHRGRRRAAGARHGTTVLGIIIVIAASACSGILDVETPTRISEDALQNPANAALIVNGAQADFECAFGAHVVASGLIADELESSGGAAIFFDYDRRSSDPVSGLYSFGTCSPSQTQLGTYRPLSTARYTADNAVRLLEGWTDEEVPDRAALIARAKVYAGFSRILLGEAFCSAKIDGGPELSPADLFASAEQQFTDAIAQAGTTNDDLRFAALVGRARARRNLDDMAGALADAQLIPVNFVFYANFNPSTPRSQNPLVEMHFRSDGIIVEAPYRGLTFGGVADPRVPVAYAGRKSADGLRDLYLTSKYPNQDSSIPIASWDEAQLIIAEAELAAGNITEAVAAINALHAKAGIPPYGGGTAAEVLTQIIEERRRELFVEGHRAWDIIHFDLAQNPAPGVTHPQGGVYGNQKCLPIPAAETP